MRIRARPTRRRVERITLNLASMIDVTFLLLIYFVLSTVFLTPEDELTPTLQVQREREVTEASDLEMQIIEVRRIDGNPVYQLGANILPTREALASAVAGLPRDAGLFISVHDHVPVGFAIAAIQVARDAGFEKVTYVPAD